MTDDSYTPSRVHIETPISEEMGDWNTETKSQSKAPCKTTITLDVADELMWMSISIVFDIYSATIKIMSRRRNHIKRIKINTWNTEMNKKSKKSEK